MSNIHLLTSVPSFARWPLNVHFFAPEAHRAWETWLKTSGKCSRPGLRILKDFPRTEEGPETEARGIDALPLDYAPLTDYVCKAQDVVGFEQEGHCVYCSDALQSGQGLQPMCPNAGCEAIGHIECWSQAALSHEGAGDILPDMLSCPSCGGEIRWGDMMKELSLRIRGMQDVQKLLKKAEKAKKAGKTA